MKRILLTVLMYMVALTSMAQEADFSDRGGGPSEHSFEQLSAPSEPTGLCGILLAVFGLRENECVEMFAPRPLPLPPVVTPPAVPEPAARWIFGVGLAWVLWLAWGRQRKARRD